MSGKTWQEAANEAFRTGAPYSTVAPEHRAAPVICIRRYDENVFLRAEEHVPGPLMGDLKTGIIR